MNPTDHVVMGHMRCPLCRYALRGQPVLHINEYGFYAVRCPECGRVTPAGESLLIGAWTGRVTLVAMLGWLLVVVGIWMAANGAMYGLGRGTTEAAISGYRQHIEDAYRAAVDSSAAGAPIVLPPLPRLPTAAGAVPIPNVPVSAFTGSFSTWWKKQDQAAILRDAGGWARVIEWPTLLIWLPMGMIGVMLGMMTAVAFDRVSLRGLVLRLPLAVAPLITFTVVSLTGWDKMVIMWAGQAAYKQIGMPLLILSAGTAAVAVTTGLFIGRPLTRWVLRKTTPRMMAGPIERLRP